MSEVRSGNSPSSSDNYFGRNGNKHTPSEALQNNYSLSHSSITLADVLRAAIAGKVDPENVFNSLPKNLTTMIDKASRHTANVGFCELPTEAQRTLFSAILEATSGTKLPPVPKTPRANRPWWKLW